MYSTSLLRREVKKIADDIQSTVLSNINELADVTKTRRKPLVLGIGTYLRGQMNERKVSSMESCIFVNIELRIHYMAI
jgi:hypothetical protein